MSSRGRQDRRKADVCEDLYTAEAVSIFLPLIQANFDSPESMLVMGFWDKDKKKPGTLASGGTIFDSRGGFMRQSGGTLFGNDDSIDNIVAMLQQGRNDSEVA